MNAVRVGVKDGVLTLVDGDAGTSISVPWPPPPDKDGEGAWQPQVMERFPDGTALALWHWELRAPPVPGAVWQRPERPLRVSAVTQLLAPPAAPGREDD